MKRKIVLVTGASSGIGEATAERLAKAGYKVYGTSRRRAEAAERSSPSYVVLHDAARPVSITLSTDQTDNKKHVVRLIVFVRRN